MKAIEQKLIDFLAKEEKIATAAWVDSDDSYVDGGGGCCCCDGLGEVGHQFDIGYKIDGSEDSFYHTIHDESFVDWFKREIWEE